MSGSRWQSDLLSAVSPCELVLALGSGWVSCVDALPWNDSRSWLRYVVYSPAYCGDLLICRFHLSSGAKWWHEGMQVGISGVTHWRIAGDDEQELRFLEGTLPGDTSVDAQALSELRRWWSWYRDYKGFDPE